jgi:hypothetical protein
MQIKDLAPPIGNRWLTRKETAALLNITRAGVNTLVRRGVLKPTPVDKARGFVKPLRPGIGARDVFPYEDVVRLRDAPRLTRMSQGQVASFAFAAFERGETVAKVVIDGRIAPERVLELYEVWLRVTGGFYCPREVVDKLKALGFKTPDSSTLVERIENLLEEIRAARASRRN